MSTIIIFADEVSGQHWLVASPQTVASLQAPVVSFDNGVTCNVETGAVTAPGRGREKQRLIRDVQIIHPGQPGYVDPVTLAGSPQEPGDRVIVITKQRDGIYIARNTDGSDAVNVQFGGGDGGRFSVRVDDISGAQIGSGNVQRGPGSQIGHGNSQTNKF